MRDPGTMLEKSRASDVLHPSWAPIGFAVLRTPLLPADELRRLTVRPEPGGAPTDVLRDIAGRPHVREALFLASPTLENTIASWLDGDSLELPPRARGSVGRYIARMTSRATPFGLCAGCATVRVGSSTRLDVGDGLRRLVRLDMAVLAEVVRRLEADPGVRGALVWRPNTTLYRVGDRFRIFETRLVDGLPVRQLVEFEATDTLASVLRLAERGACIGELATTLIDHDIDLTEAEDFVDELIDAQLLESDLNPPVTGGDSLSYVLERLIAASANHPAIAVLTSVSERMRDIGIARSSGVAPLWYRAIADELRPFAPETVDLSPFHVDLYRSGDNVRVGPNVVEEVARAVELLSQVTPRPVDRFDTFRRRFAERYGETRVPLGLALDLESGVGYRPDGEIGEQDSPLLAGLSLGYDHRADRRWTDRDDVLLGLISGPGKDRASVAELSATDLDALGDESSGSLPPVMTVEAQVAARSCEDVNRGDFQVLIKSALGNSGAQLFGRFCHGDADLAAGVRTLIASEESSDPEAVFAEIAHVPEPRLANILQRPMLRQHEIVYLGVSGAERADQLALTDLLVSVSTDRVHLHSRRLDREVVPRLAAAHNTSRSLLGVYRFLADLQHQDGNSRLIWSWGALSRAPFLPRVTAGRLVLSRARWRLTGRALTALSEGGLGWSEWRVISGAPRWIALTESDNEWLVDLEDPEAGDLLRRSLRGRSAAELVEFFPGLDDLCAEGTAGRYVHELLVPLRNTRTRAKTVRSSVARTQNAHLRSRRLPPGTDWLYAKLYCGTSTAETVLRDAVQGVVRAAMRNRTADSWFFIRYADPEQHLRIRLRGDATRLRNSVLPALNDAVVNYVDDGRIWRVTYDTYDREVERYGGADGIELCERIFAADSEACLRILTDYEGDFAQAVRWKFVMTGIDRLLSDFDFDLAMRHRWAASRRGAYYREFAVSAQAMGQIGRRWRVEGREISALLTEQAISEHPLADGLAALSSRSLSVRPIATTLRRRESQLSRAVSDIVASLAHMHAIRLLRANPRAQELVIYDFLERHYRSLLARNGRP